jgi:hypothetical protein
MKTSHLLGLLLVLPAMAVEPQPVPVMQAVPQPYDQVSFQRDGVEVARCHFGPTLNRPFVFPIIGPSDRSLTRMGHPHDPVSHSHHNSFWLSHNDVNGVSFWDDRGNGRIVHQRIEQLEDGPTSAVLQTASAWMTKEGQALLNERRRIAVQMLPDREWLLILDVQLAAVGTNTVTLGQTPFGLAGVRMAKTIGVKDGGGTIRNSEGGVNEAGVFRKPARWVDYSGPISATMSEGLTLLDHPSNPNHPSMFHVRDDGWMGASLTLGGARVIPPGQPLQLRYGLYVHAGIPAPEKIQQQWEAFSKQPVFEFKAKAK